MSGHHYREPIEKCVTILTHFTILAFCMLNPNHLNNEAWPRRKTIFCNTFQCPRHPMDTQMSRWLQHNWGWQWLCHPPACHCDTRSTTHFSSLAMNLNTILAAQLTAVSDVKHGEHHFLSYQTNRPIAQAYIPCILQKELPSVHLLTLHLLYKWHPSTGERNKGPYAQTVCILVGGK